MKPDLDLDVATPQKVPEVLRRAAESFEATQPELEAAWGDPHAGRVWHELAKILNRAAASCDTAIKKYV